MKMPRRSRRELAFALLALAASAFALVAAAHDANLSASVRERLVQLRAEIARHDELYFQQAAPEISDAEYDALKRELRALQAELPAGAPVDAGPASDVLGDDRSGRFPTARHRAPMLGLEKSFSEAELRRFLARIARAAGTEEVTFVVEPKYDGLAISLTYERGHLVRAVTRGDGSEGEIVTANLRACTAVPRELPAAPRAPVPDLVEIRGEVFMEHAEFDRLNAERAAAGEALYAHPRNLAAGTLKSLDAAPLRSRRLALVCYGGAAWEPAATEPTSQRELLARLRAWGLPVPPERAAAGAEGVWASIRAIARGRHGFSAPLDGAVVKVDDVALRRRLGESRTAPAWAIAHKFEAERVETRLRAITWRVGRTGALTPVAELEPVAIAGTTVARASLHNRREIERRDYRVGDLVQVEKAGEIIPQLAGVNLALRPATAPRFAAPRACPACAAPLLESENGVVLRCPNRACPAQLKRRIEHFVSGAGIDLRGLGPVLVGVLVDRGAVKEIDDLFRLRREQWEEMAGAKAAERILAEIERGRNAEAWRVVGGLGLPGVGPASARRLMDRVGDLRSLRDVTVSDLTAGGLHAQVALDVARELARPEVTALLERLIAANVGVAPAARRRGEPPPR